VLELLGEVPFTNRFYDLCTGNLNNLWNQDPNALSQWKYVNNVFKQKAVMMYF